MSFIDHYLEKENLDPIPEANKKNLDKLEKELQRKINESPILRSTFEDVAKKYGPQIADIVGRFSKHWKSVDGWSISTVVGSLRFVMNIGVEVKQLVELMEGNIVSPGMSPSEAKEAKTDFGKSLVWFIWKTVDPLKGRLSWIPFRKTIERKLVNWVADMAFDFAGDLVDRHFSAMSADGPGEAGIAFKVL